MRTNGSTSAGASLFEVLIAVAALTVGVAAAAPSWVQWRQMQRLESAAREIGLLIVGLQSRASAYGAVAGLVLESEGRTLSWRVAVDGDGDGLRRADLRTGTDHYVTPSANLTASHAGITLGLSADVPALPGSVAPSDGLALGRSDLVSLSPDGTASTGSIYLSDGHGHGAVVRVYGAGGRVGLWLYRDPVPGWFRRW